MDEKYKAWHDHRGRFRSLVATDDDRFFAAQRRLDKAMAELRDAASERYALGRPVRVLHSRGSFLARVTGSGISLGHVRVWVRNETTDKMTEQSPDSLILLDREG